MKVKIIDPYGSELVKDYTRIIKEFGLDSESHRLLPNPNKLVRRGVVFASRGLKEVIKAIKEKKRFYVLSGIMPTGKKIHFGNKMVVENIRYFQEHGGEAYILVADLEAAAARGIDLKQAKKDALEFHIPAYVALGLDPKKTFFYFQSENKDVTNFAFEASKKVTENEFRAIYGNVEPGRVMSAFEQVGDILYPQLKEPMPGVIPVGIDQDPHIRLTRDIAKRLKEKYGFFSPAGLYHKYTPSLDGSLKMSKSKPESVIEIPEEPKGISKKIMGALTGGRDTVEEQRRIGGMPEKCVVFELYKQHLIEDDKELKKIYDDCRAGKLLCGEDKKNCCRLMEKFMDGLGRRIGAARENIKNLKFIE